jgi:alpha-maltose-1-phosphate synthase
LPVVVSDWDGYKDTVRHGIDGYRVPTLMPAAGLGADMAYRHALEIDNYDVYCGNACSVVAVDVEKAAKFFSLLFASPALRQQMGEAGRRRANEIFDWARIIPQYEALWQELGEIRLSVSPAPLPAALAWPARMDPFAAFAAYPTHLLGSETRLALSSDNIDELASRIESLWKLAMVAYAGLTRMSPDEVATVLRAARGGVQPAKDLLHDIPAARRLHVLRGLAWLVKLGIFVIADQ